MLVFALLLALAVLRFVLLGYPDLRVFDEILYFTPAQALLAGGAPQLVHPPLGIIMLAAGMKCFGVSALGMRVAPALAGVAGIMLTYAIALRLGLNRTGAFFAAVWLAFDPLWFFFSRVGMLDIFLALGILGFAYCYLSRWYLAAGVCLGLALAVKWLAAAVIIALLLAVVWSWVRGRITFREALGRMASFGLIPLALYSVIFSFGMQAWDAASFLAWHKAALTYQLSVASWVPYGSPWWSWFIIPQGIPAVDIPAGTGVRKVMIVENPAMLWMGALSLSLVTVWSLRSKEAGWLLVPALAALLYLPWAFTSRGVYFYYLLPLLPFMYLCLSRFALAIFNRGWFKAVPWVVTLYAALGFTGLYSVITGIYW